jgi:hypothetical protein
MTVAVVHSIRVATAAQPHIGVPLLAVFVLLGAFACLSLIFPQRLRTIFFGLFATLIAANSIDDLAHWGFIQHLWSSYALELAAFVLSAACLGVSTARPREGRGFPVQDIGNAA